MDRLRGKTILIGREAGQGRLLVALQGSSAKVTIGSVGSVPSSVSRCLPDVGTAHCKIEIDHSGNMVITNMKSENITYVNGLQVQSKRIDSTSSISLGRERFPINLNTVLRAAITLAGNTSSVPAPKPSKTYSIRHLERVWNEYEEAMETIQRNQQERGKRRMLPIMIGTASAILAPIVGYFSTQTLWVTIPIAAISFIIYFRNYTEKDTSIEDKKKVVNKLYDDYVCPNPDCHHFMGNQPYKLMRQNTKCPYCHCNFTE